MKIPFMNYPDTIKEYHLFMININSYYIDIIL